MSIPHSRPAVSDNVRRIGMMRPALTDANGGGTRGNGGLAATHALRGRFLRLLALGRVVVPADGRQIG